MSEREKNEYLFFGLTGYLMIPLTKIQQLGHKEEQDRNCLKHKENGQE